MIRFMMNLGIVPWPLNADLTAYWTMWATVATAAATVGLVVVAWFAWKAALRTLQGQQTHAEITALKEYMNALHALARLAHRTPPAFEPAAVATDAYTRHLQNQSAYRPYVNAMVHDVEVAGSIWRAYHFDGRLDAGVFAAAERSLIEAQDWRLNSPEGMDEAKNQQFDLNAEFANSLSSWVNVWQVAREARSLMNDVVERAAAEFIANSPCRPDDS